MFFRTLFYGLMGFVVALTPTRTVHALSQCELQCVIETGGGPDCFGADDRGYCGSHGGGGGGASGGSGSASTGSGGGNASSLSVCNFAAPPRWIPNVTAIYDTESTWRSDIALWENTTYSGKNPDEEEVLYAHSWYSAVPGGDPLDGYPFGFGSGSCEVVMESWIDVYGNQYP